MFQVQENGASVSCKSGFTHLMLLNNALYRFCACVCIYRIAQTKVHKNAADAGLYFTTMRFVTGIYHTKEIWLYY
jgi:hypothetical protein